MNETLASRLPDLLALNRLWKNLGGHETLTMRGTEWVLLANPNSTGRALIVGGDNPLTSYLVARLFGEVVVWKLDHERANNHSAFLHDARETQRVEYVPAKQVSNKLANIGQQFSLIVFDDSIHACPSDMTTLLEQSRQALVQGGQCCIVSGNKYGPGRLRSKVRRSIRYPTTRQVSRAATKAGFVNKAFHYPYPNHANPRELLGWPYGQSRLRRRIAVTLLCRLGLEDLTYDSFILLASQFKNRSVLQDFADSTSSIETDLESQVTECLVRPNGTLVVLFRRLSKKYVLRVPLNTAANDRLQHATRMTQIVCDERDWLKSIVPTQHTNGCKYGLPYYVENQCRGVTAMSLLDDGQLQEKVQSAAMLFLCDLSGSVEKTLIDEKVFEKIIGNYIEPIVQHLPQFKDQLLQIVDGLRKSMIDRTISFTQTHGDFYVSNVFCDASSGEICGVIDWDASETAGLPLIDLFHFLQGCNRHRRKSPIGKRIVAAVSGKLLLTYELNLINRYMEKLQVDRQLLRPLIILYWARHICVHIKYRRGELDPNWVVDNIEHPICQLIQLQPK